MSILGAYLFWQLRQGFDTPKMAHWTQVKVDKWIDNIVSSSNYLSSIDSTEAYEIGKCAMIKINDSFSLDEIIALEKIHIDSQKIILAPIVLECMFPVGFQNIYTTISDKSQINIDANNFNGYWNPTVNDYRKIEVVLETAINTDKQDYIEKLTSENSKFYYRQYLFYLDKNNDSIAYINALCGLLKAPYDSSGVIVNKTMDWKNKFITVNDGGDCYWSIRINMSKDNYSNFLVNGY